MPSEWRSIRSSHDSGGLRRRLSSAAVNGLGRSAVSRYDRGQGWVGDSTLYATTQAMIGRVFQTPGLAGAFSSFQINVPQLFATSIATRVKAAGIR